MKAALISLRSKSSDMTVEAMRNYFDDVDDLDIRNLEVNLGVKAMELLYNGAPLKNYDCVYAKGSFRYAPLLASASSIMQNKGVYMPIDARSFTISHDKLLTHIELQKNNIPMPKTYLSSTPEAAKELLEKLNYPVIMKFPQGTQGKGVMIADSLKGAKSMLDALSALKQPFIIQEYIETEGVDIRAIVVGERVVAAMKRKATGEEIRANIHAGGKGEACELDSHTKKIAIETAKAVGAEICGVDILESAKGPTVIEVNISPGLQGITAATKVNVADKIAKYLFERTKSIKEGTKKAGTKKILTELGVETPGQEIITDLDFRGKRILLPEMISNVTKFTTHQDYAIEAKEGELRIKKFDVEKGEEKKKKK
ncbi:RimK family alpha-L-glutamate ligase [Candidatus Woesearchaeota archaeon]|nr:RimK family alpha-L-glutamate ligase [Candidatus Woesearchaeota archaeon]